MLEDRAGRPVLRAAAGPGVRFSIPKFVDSELRLDFAFPIVGSTAVVDPNIGTSAFF